MSKEISQAVIRRLPRYYRYLGELLDEGVERISSNDLSHRMKVTASQIRQDLNNFGGFGQQGYGYNVQFLYEEIGKIMGLNTEHRIIIEPRKPISCHTIPKIIFFIQSHSFIKFRFVAQFRIQIIP